MTLASVWPPAGMDEEDARRIFAIRDELFSLAGSEQEFVSEMVRLVRLAIDEVIDTGRSGRFRFGELETTEKAYIGVRTEILFRNKFSLEKGKLDVVIAGEDVDIKNTTSGEWMIPTHSIGKLCLLIKSEPDSDPGTCSAGLALARLEYMRAGGNQDKKRQFRSAHTNKILWLFEDMSFPSNVLERLNDNELKQILEAESGAKRIAALFMKIQRVPIPRHIVEDVARQTDAAKRIRKNQGARDLLEPSGTFILSGDQHRKWITRMGLPNCFRGEFISVTPDSEEERKVIDEFLKEQKLLELQRAARANKKSG